MSTTERDSVEQVEPTWATVKATRLSMGWMPDWVQAQVAVPERGLSGHKGPTEHIIMDGFIWHSISCVCDSCVRNDNSFNFQLNRRDFRPYVIAGAPTAFA